MLVVGESAKGCVRSVGSKFFLVYPTSQRISPRVEEHEGTASSRGVLQGPWRAGCRSELWSLDLSIGSFVPAKNRVPRASIYFAGFVICLSFFSFSIFTFLFILLSSTF